MTAGKKSTATKTDAFPSNVPVAALQSVSLDGLWAADENEVNRLLRAAILDGVFYLDVSGYIAEKHSFPDMVQDIHTLSKDLFSLSEEEKCRFDVDTLPGRLAAMKLNGYKPIGRNVGGVAGNRDGFESYAIPKDGIFGLATAEEFSHPSIVDSHRESLTRFMAFLQIAGQKIFQGLSKALAIDPSTTFESFHRPPVSSPDLLRLLKYHPQPISERGSPQMPHTDLGSLTFLFTEQPGLQVLSRGASEWAYVAPRPGHAIVNLGDGMAMLSNGLLQSCLHRVSPLPSSAFETRYSFAYLLRAEDRTPMGRLSSSLIPRNEGAVGPPPTSAEWLASKFKTLRAK